MATAAPPWVPAARRVGQSADADLLRRQPLITLAAAAAAGVLCGDRLPTQAVLLLALPAGATGWWLSSGQANSQPDGLRSAIGWSAVLLTIGGLFAVIQARVTQRYDQATLRPLLTDTWQPVVLEAGVVDRVELRPNRLAELRGNGEGRRWQSIFGVAVERLRMRDRWKAASGGARVIADGNRSDLLPGDRIRIFGQIQAIPPPRNPGGLDLRDTYRARGQSARIRVDAADQIMLQNGTSWSPYRLLAQVGTRGESLLTHHLGEERGPLAAALVLGRREAVDRETREKLLETGTAHLLSVSGMHLGMVAIAATWILALAGVSRYPQIAIILAICVLYAAVTGGRPPVLRAALIVAAALLGLWTGRLVHPLNALAFAALVLLLINPENLRSVGVHLSFVAVGTLIFAGRHVTAMRRAEQWQQDPLDRFLESRRARLLRWLGIVRSWVWVTTQLSFWVWLTTTPLVWHQFNIVTPVSVPANVLLSPPLMVALISGLTTVVVGLIFEPLAVIPGICCRSMLDSMTWIIEFLAALPGGHLWLPAPPGWWVSIFYLVVAGGFLLPKTWKRSRWLIAWIGLWCAIAFVLATTAKRQPHGGPEASLEMTFIDVGHGTSVLIRHPHGGDWLYDCGRLGDPSQSSRPIEAVLWHKGIRRLDGIILSHADSDHYNALPALLRRFSVDRIIAPPGMLATEEPGLRAVRQAIASHQIPVVEKRRGDHLFDAMQSATERAAWASVLHPPKEALGGRDNASSLTLRIDHGGRSLLLPGDLEMPGTENLLRCERPPPGGLLMAPHHGSLQEPIRPLLDWCRPTTIVISGNDRADRPAVHRTYRQSGADLHITAATGAITARVDHRGRLTVERWLDQVQ